MLTNMLILAETGQSLDS